MSIVPDGPLRETVRRLELQRRAQLVSAASEAASGNFLKASSLGVQATTLQQVMSYICCEVELRNPPAKPMPEGQAMPPLTSMKSLRLSPEQTVLNELLRLQNRVDDLLDSARRIGNFERLAALDAQSRAYLFASTVLQQSRQRYRPDPAVS